jgi:hypothetical protein
MIMPDGTMSAQLLDLANKVNDIRTDVAVIKVQTSPIQDHEQRLRSLEASRSRIWGWWTAAVVIGSVAGWVLSGIVRLH